MTDIVERLRDSDQIDVFGLRLEAADEIERLRKAIKEYLRECDNSVPDYSFRILLRDRMRAALEQKP